VSVVSVFTYIFNITELAVCLCLGVTETQQLRTVSMYVYVRSSCV